jgi:hypothetical protein
MALPLIAGLALRYLATEYVIQASLIARTTYALPVGVINPRGHPSRELLAVSTFFKRIRPGLLQASQFPETLQDAQGTISKPAAW